MQTKIELTITHDGKISNEKLRDEIGQTLADYLSFKEGMEDIHLSMAGYAGASFDLQ